MTASDILRSALADIRRDIPATLRITLLPWAIAMIAQLAFVQAYGGHALTDAAMFAMDAGRHQWTMPLAMLSMIAALWITYSWLRFIQRRNAAQGIHPATARSIAGYGVTVILFLAAMTILLLWIATIAVFVVMQTPGIWPIRLAFIAATLSTYYLTLRFAPLFANAAAGTGIRPHHAWDQSAPLRGPIFRIALCLTLAQCAAQILGILTAPDYIENPPLLRKALWSLWTWTNLLLMAGLVARLQIALPPRDA